MGTGTNLPCVTQNTVLLTPTLSVEDLTTGTISALGVHLDMRLCLIRVGLLEATSTQTVLSVVFISTHLTQCSAIMAALYCLCIPLRQSGKQAIQCQFLGQSRPTMVEAINIG